MARTTNTEGVGKMVRILRLLNDLAPDEPGRLGEPLPLSDFAARLGLDPKETVMYINKINDGCGDALPEMLVMYDEQDETVTPFRIESAFSHPMRFSGAEARGLLVALEAAGYDQDELADKVKGALPAMDQRMVGDIRGHAGNGPYAATLTKMTSAARRHEVMSITYRRPWEPSAQSREIEPVRIYFDAAQETWYVVAWCRRARGWRTFRIDRIEAAEPTGETFCDRDDDRSEDETFSFSHAKNAVLAVRDPSAVSDTYDWRGLSRAERPDPFDYGKLSPQEIENGAYIAHLPWIEGSFWLPQMLLRTQGAVEALRPAALRDTVRRLARDTLEAIDRASLFD